MYVLESYVKLVYFQWIIFRELWGSVVSHVVSDLRSINMESLED